MDPRTSKGAGVRCEINVTPLVDVCLVLLIIFMVVTPLIGNGADEIPATDHPPKMAEDREDVVIVVRHDGAIRVDEKPATMANLPATLRDVHARAPARQLVVKADRRLAYRDVREVLGAAHRAGFSGAGLVARLKQTARGATGGS